jgi:O-antigen/teichoic acid export membrane protein
LIKFLKNIEKSEILKNASYLLIATVLSQGIGVLFMPVLARLYTPGSFGILTSFTAVSTIIGHLANGKYAQAIVVPKNDSDANILYLICKKITLYLGILSIFIIAFLLIFGIFKIDKLWLIFIPFVLVSGSFLEINTFYLTRIKFFKRIAISKISQSSINIISSLIFGIFSLFNQFGLILGVIFGQIASVIVTRISLFKNSNSTSLNISKSVFFDTIKKYKAYSIFGIPGAFVDSIAQQLPVYFLIFFFDNGTIGQYGLATRVVQIPGILIANSINNVIYQKFSELNSYDKPLKPLLIRTSLNIAKIILIPMIIFAIFSPLLFPIIFGNQWTESGKYARILFLIYTIRTIVSPITTIFTVKNKLNISFSWQVLYFFISVIFFLLMNLLSFTFYNILIYFLVVEFILYGLYFYLALEISKK